MPDVRLENKSARILHISLGGGANIAVPPTEGGIKVTLSDEEKARFDANVATETVQEWIAAGDLLVTDLGEAEADDEPEAEDEA